MFEYDYGKYMKRTLVISTIVGGIIGFVNYISWLKHRESEQVKETFMRDVSELFDIKD